MELATLGELRLVERAAEVVLAPRDFASLRAHVKVASTENGVIFGNVGTCAGSLNINLRKGRVFVLFCEYVKE